MKLPPYPEYKDSGVPWLGEIPAHWDATRLKRVSHVQTGVTLGKRYEQTDLIERPYLRVANVQNGFLNLKRIKTVAVPAKEAESAELRKGDVVITEGGDIDKLGRGAIWNGDIESCLHQNHIFAIRPVSDLLLPEFLSRMLESHHGRSYFYLTSKRTTNLASTNQTTLGLFPLFLPNIEEQTQIARFLDWKTAQINKFIRNKRRLIELLKEQKQNIISALVSGKCEVRRVKGEDGVWHSHLTPRPSHFMKPSGVEWIGDIPEHWEARRLKTIADVVLGKMLKTFPSKGDEFKPYLRSANIQWFEPNISNVTSMWFSQSEMEQYRISKDDILVSEGGEVGRACIWEDELEECYIQNSVHKVTAGSEILPLFLLYQFSAFGSKGVFKAIVNRVSIAHLTREKLVAISFCKPPIEEQESIIAHIKVKSMEIDKAVSRAQREIELMREYRTRLISDVVTGKVDVRNVKCEVGSVNDDQFEDVDEIEEEFELPEDGEDAE